MVPKLRWHMEGPKLFVLVPAIRFDVRSGVKTGHEHMESLNPPIFDISASLTVTRSVLDSRHIVI